MKEDPAVSGGYTAEIPASATQGGVVDYFIEALGDDDTAVAAKGSANKTLKITMLGPNGQPLVAAGRQGEEAAEEAGRADEAPSLVLRARLRQRRRLGDAATARSTTRDVVKPAGFAHVQAAAHRARGRLLRQRPSSCCRVQLRFQLITGGTPFYDPADSLLRRRIMSARREATRSRASAGPRTSSAKGTSAPTSRAPSALGTIRHVATFESQHPSAARTHEPDLHRHRPSGPDVRGRRRGHHVQPDPGVRADVRDERAARLHQVHVPRRPERRRRVC